MTRPSFIWDLDGTLFDSYPAIVPSAREICAEAGLRYEEAYVRDFVRRSSVNALLEQAAEARGLDFKTLKAAFNARSDSRADVIRAIPHARELLEALREAGCPSYVYTHRGASSFTILENTGLAPFLAEVLTSESGFPRKPDPAAILYLLGKYHLDPANTYYVGDRQLDMEAARNAGVGSILFREPGNPTEPLGCESYVIGDLREIRDIFGV